MILIRSLQVVKMVIILMELTAWLVMMFTVLG